jgi:uncharacterized glyoxalase superfamily protein PhnB
MTAAPTTTSPIWPCFAYRDARAAIRFLVEAFGFEESAVHAGEDDQELVAHAELRWPGGRRRHARLGRQGRGAGRPAGRVGAVYLVVDDPDALYQRAVAAGASVVRPPRDEDYGSRDFVVRDPEGVYWSFGTYSGA